MSATEIPSEDTTAPQGTTTVNAMRIPVGNLTFEGYGKFTPQADATPLETQHLFHLFLACIFAAQKAAGLAYPEFIEEHGLQRFFTPVGEITPQ